MVIMHCLLDIVYTSAEMSQVCTCNLVKIYGAFMHQEKSTYCVIFGNHGQCVVECDLDSEVTLLQLLEVAIDTTILTCKVLQEG